MANGDQPTGDMPPVQDTTKEKILGPWALQGGALEQTLARDNLRRTAEARMHWDNAKRAASVIAASNSIDPNTKQPFVNPETGQPYTPEDRAKLQAQFEAAMGHYAKIAGTDKAHKGAIAKARGIMEHVMNRGAQQQGGGLPPPPGMQQGQQMLSDARMQATQQDLEGQHKLAIWKQEQQIIRDDKIAEEQAKAKATAEAKKATTGSARPAQIGAISTRKAKMLAQAGKKYKDINGDDIDVMSLPDEMGLKAFTVKESDGSWDMRYEPFSPNEKVVTVGNQTWTINPMDVEGLASDEGTLLGQHNVPTSSATTDPYGLTSRTQRVPSAPGIPGRGGVPTAPPAGRVQAVPQATAPTAGRTVPRTARPSAAAAPPLDETGHIPIPANVDPGRRTVIEMANQLIDGVDIKEVKGPSKALPLAESMARSTGWDRGMFTPLQKRQIAIASRYIQEMQASPSLKVLDEGFIKQLPMLGASTDPHSATQRVVSKLSAMAETKDQQEFLRLYRQIAGQISSLGQISRGSSRITEAQVNRLLSEMPNPSNTASSKDAIARLGRLQDEINAATQKGSFEEVAKGRVGGATPPPAEGMARFTDGGKTYKIPSNLVPEFQKDHPNAQRQ